MELDSIKFLIVVVFVGVVIAALAVVIGSRVYDTSSLMEQMNIHTLPWAQAYNGL
jgi:hypothetical protein